ncbi:hypothetical protein TNCV_2395901 [Trichonephila clavipes]|nr:hypothetical protein TNCV_2395901 [Trichonephila clavipes]
MDLVILNHDQVTRTIPELAPHYPNFHTMLTSISSTRVRGLSMKIRSVVITRQKKMRFGWEYLPHLSYSHGLASTELSPVSFTC